MGQVSLRNMCNTFVAGRRRHVAVIAQSMGMPRRARPVKRQSRPKNNLEPSTVPRRGHGCGPAARAESRSGMARILVARVLAESAGGPTYTGAWIYSATRGVRVRNWV